MTLPSSGLITLQNIQNTFGGSNPIGLNEYYRGGSLVPNWTGTLGIPTSGAIDLADFYGARTYPTQTIYRVTSSFTVSLSSQPKIAILSASRFGASAVSIGTPSTSVASCSTIRYQQNTNADDGHAAGIWLANLGTATSVTFNLSAANIWMITVINNVTSLTTVATGATNSSAALNLNTSSQGFAVAATVNNFGGVGSTISNCDENYTNGDACTLGVDTVTPGGTVSYAGSGTSIQLNVAATFGY